jgi:hypothetical protein
MPRWPFGRECEEWVVGLLQEGDPCEGDDLPECAPGLTCVTLDGDPDRRSCRQHALEGESCDGVCAPDLWCNQSNRTCAAYVELGSACDDNGALLCPSGQFCNEGVCTLQAGPGEPCEEWRGCRNHECTDGVCPATPTFSGLCVVPL